LWNISTKKKLHDFKGWESAIRCCVSSPALDVVAVGCSNGIVHVHKMRYAEELMSFNHQIRGAVTALSFRAGNLIKILLSANFLAICSQPYF
jgi:U3 small nucleolar RNA-associated protein 21